MIKRIVVAIALSILMVASAQATIVSVNELPDTPPFVGDFEVQKPIKGALERTHNFDVIPGENFTFDMTLQNNRTVENMAAVLLRIDLPNGSQYYFFEEDILLEGNETVVYNFEQIIPSGLQLYGRYTMKLIINNNYCDLIQWDVNDRAEIIVRWDDGIMDNARAFINSGDKWAIRGCMPNGAVIDEIGAYILSENDPGWPWPDGIHQPIDLQVWDASGPGGMPGTIVYTSGDVYVNPTTSEATAYPGITAPQPHFFVANQQIGDYPSCEGQGLDGSLDHIEQLFVQNGGVWGNYLYNHGDFMIWAMGSVD
jgi:hypothetical protein